jgi:hypothetical protein
LLKPTTIIFFLIIIMVSKTVIATAVIATVGVTAQVDGIINSIVTQISNGIVAGRQSNVPQAQAGSEVAQIITAINGNSDIQNLFTKAANVVLGGINSDGVLQLVDTARSSLAAFEGSDDFKSVDSLIGKYITDLNPPAAIASVQANLSPILGLVLPPIQSLSKAHQNVAASVEEVKTVGVSLLNRVGLLGTRAAASEAASTSAVETSSVAASSAAPSSAPASSAAPTSSAAASSSKAPESSTTPATKPATSSAHSTIAAATSSSITQVNGGIAVQGGILAAGFVAAGALLL